MTQVDNFPVRNAGPSTLRVLLKRPSGLMVPGVHDAITARLAVIAGFETLYVSGSAVSSATLGIPDLGLITLTEMARVAHAISQTVSAPIIVDADTGYGNALGVIRAVMELEAAGAAAIQIEDQVSPKRCGHLDGKRVVSEEEMEAKISAAVSARRNPDTVIIARTDARETEGMAGAIARARRYVAAGADVIFPEALYTAEEFREFARSVDAVLLANMTEFGKTAYLSAADLHQLGYQAVLFPVSALRVAMRSILEFFTDLRGRGTQKDWLPRMITRQELYDVIEYSRYEEIEGRILRRHAGIASRPGVEAP